MARERESSDEEGETKVPRQQKQGWVQIQQNTFTNWCNEQLRHRQDIRIADLETDFEDGLKLIALVQALQTAHGKALYKMRRYSKNPKMRAQKLDNISYGLDMLLKDGVYLVNIGTEDLAECNLKLILGLIWTLILKYQISGYVGDEKKKQVVPPKKLMLAWFNAVLPDQKIGNFAKDWNDGIALSGLINYCDPNQLQNWRELDPRKSTENCREAMRIARDYYEVPQVLSPEDLSNPEVDELSGMTYLSYFVRREGPGWYATLNWVRSKVPDKNVENFDTDWNDGTVLCGLADAQGGEVPEWKELDPENKVENCATGIEAGNRIGVKPNITAEQLADPEVDDLQVMAYAASFQHPKAPAREIPVVVVKWGELVKVSAVNLENQGDIDGMPGPMSIDSVVNQKVTLMLKVLDNRVASSDITAELDSPGQPTQINLRRANSNEIEASFTPTEEGVYKVTVFSKGETITGCPVRVTVAPDITSMPQSVRVGAVPVAVVNEDLQFQVDVSEAGKGDIDVEITNGRILLPVRFTHEKGVYTIHTKAKEAGTYVVNIRWDGEPITDDPMKIDIFDPFICRAEGDGLTRGRTDSTGEFVVDTKGAGKGELNVMVEGPNSIAKCNIDHNANGTYTVTYVPVEVGTYTVKVMWNDRHITGSPFHPRVTDSRKVRIMGGVPPGTDIDGIIRVDVGKTYSLDTETVEAGPGKLTATVKTPSGKKQPVPIETQADGRATLNFIVKEEGEHLLFIFFADIPIKGSPFRLIAKPRVLPVDHNKVTVMGEGTRMAKVYRQSEFTVDGSLAGPGVPGVRMSGIKTDIEVQLIPQGNNVYKAVYVPEVPGAYLLHLTWSDRQVQGSPFKVTVAARPNADKVTASGNALKMLVANQTSRLVIDSRQAGSGELTARCMGPSKMAEVHIGDNRDGTYSLLICPAEAGKHVLEVRYGGEHIQGSPFHLRVAGAPDPKQVKCFGPGLEHGILAVFNGRFICETRGAGAGQLKVRIHGPKGAFKVQMKRNDNKDRTIDVRYNPVECGDYTIQVKWSDQHVTGSPFLVKIVDTQEELVQVQKDFPTETYKPNGDEENGWMEDI